MVLGVVIAGYFLGFTGCQTTRKAVVQARGWIPWIHSGGQSSRPVLSPVGEVRTRGLALTLRLDPFPVNLLETRRVEAVIQLENVSSRFIQLEFPTTQRFEVFVRDEAGKLVAQWSEDQAFEPTPGTVGINPGEHLEYLGVFSTRDLRPSKRYTVTAFFPNRSDLKAELSFVPER